MVGSSPGVVVGGGGDFPEGNCPDKPGIRESITSKYFSRLPAFSNSGNSFHEFRQRLVLMIVKLFLVLQSVTYDKFWYNDRLSFGNGFYNSWTTIQFE